MGKKEKEWEVGRESSLAEGGLRDGGSGGSTADYEEQDDDADDDRHDGAAAAAAGAWSRDISDGEAALLAQLDALADTTDTAVPAAVPAATELSECNASVEGSGGTGGGGGPNSSGVVDRGGAGGDAPEQQRSSTHGAASRGDGVVSGEDIGAGVKPRGGWRIGEGLSVPKDGAHAVWSRFKAVLEDRAAAAVAGRGGDDAAAGGRRRRHSSAAGEELVGEVLLEERREGVLAAVRWAWKVRPPRRCVYLLPPTLASSMRGDLVGGLGTLETSMLPSRRQRLSDWS